MRKRTIFTTLFFALSLLCAFAQNGKIKGVNKINSTTVEINYANGHQLTLDFYGKNIVRLFQDNEGGIVRNPEATPPAQILVDNPRKDAGNIYVAENENSVNVSSQRIAVKIDKTSGNLSIADLSTQKVVLQSVAPFHFDEKSVEWRLKCNDNEYFYGGGVQNGRFSHKGKIIQIENENSWTDGGVASPNPFYWSTGGYGILWHTFKKGSYDFGAKNKNEVKLTHKEKYLDLFVMVDSGAVPLLNDFYQLTGNPVLLPKFGFYEGHLNAYNRDYWKEDKNGILFEDGKRYKESQKDKTGTKESLNGEKNNYQFSARAVVDRYKTHDMPLGWLLPNDGYGAGYGQTETLDGNIANLREFAKYAAKNGVKTGLWTQSELHPKAGISALLQRDIVKEVRDAEVRVLKTDVAWVGYGYSFGLNGVADASKIMTYYGNDARPFIISLDGWAGTQRYAGIWSGDQVGGKWEYIRFHIPTYIGSGLSGNPNISSDMDGIFGGKNATINARDFQWKTFSPMQLNMDGWGSNPKYPHIFGEPTTSINRNYLKLKSELMPYIYSTARESVDGMPMVRAMFLQYPNEYTLGKATQYQYMFGEYFLVAPIYQATDAKENGDDIRNGIYLPEGEWYDYFTGEKYIGGRIINNFDAPIWKLPLFVKAGAIVPMYNANNNLDQVNKNLRIVEVYPNANSQFTLYDDDGLTEKYKMGQFATTDIHSQLDKKDVLKVTFNPTKGSFEGMVKEQSTLLHINISQLPKKVFARVNGKKVKLQEVNSMEKMLATPNSYYYDKAPDLNKFSTKNSPFAKVKMIKNPQLSVMLASTDITKSSVEVEVKGYKFDIPQRIYTHKGAVETPTNGTVTDANIKPYTLTPTWNSVPNADYYEIEFNGMIYSTIKECKLLFEDLKAETKYSFKLRAVNSTNHSEWTAFEATTKANPLEFAIKGIVGETSCENQGGQGVEKLFDFDPASVWHTKWGVSSTPFTLTMDLKTINQLDKMTYIPRENGGNGVILKGTVAYSMDKINWSKAETFTWDNNGSPKTIQFAAKPTARYIKVEVEQGVGGFGSGQELYVFKVPGTESYIPGDINHDRLLDMNDFMSYLNYTGLRLGDGDFEGYVSKGDLNQNGLIDAYDISVVATQLRGGVANANAEKIAGDITVAADKAKYKAGETITITVKGKGLKALNAISFALPYDQSKYKFLAIEPIATKDMENMTNDRLHTSGVKSLYPTFTNIANKPTVNGDVELFRITFKAQTNLTYNLTPQDIFLVDKSLNVITR